MQYILPGQIGTLHFSIIMDDPLHGLPPFDAFTKIVRVLVLDEVPQVVLH